MPPAEQLTCSVEGCAEPIYAKRMCHPHYDRNHLYGDPNYMRPAKSRVQCAVTGCDRIAESRGWCGKHYTRWKRHKSPADLEPRVCIICGTIFDPPGSRSTNCGSPDCKRARKIQANTASAKNRTRPEIERECVGCGVRFTTTSPNRKYCNRKCPGRAEYNATPLKQAMIDKDYPTIIGLLKARTVEDDGCWIWQGGYATTTAYPQFGFSKAPKGMRKTYLAHRVMLEAKVGHDITGLHAHHACGRPSCINPSHLQLASAAENVAEMMARRTYEARIEALEQALAGLNPDHPLLTRRMDYT